VISAVPQQLYALDIPCCAAPVFACAYLNNPESLHHSRLCHIERLLYFADPELGALSLIQQFAKSWTTAKTGIYLDCPHLAVR
jgi:hypothetical protein